MPNLTQLIDAWGYAAIFLIAILGNLGLPVPEETVLTVAGYLAWQGQLRFPAVVLVAILSAVLGDNMAYWLGRRYGQRLLRRFAAARVERMQGYVVRYGMLAVFVARFVPGLRFMAGPLAGSTGLGPVRFLVANLLGAAVYVPIVASAGYAIGYGFGDRIETLRRAAGDVRAVALVVALLAVAAWAVLARRARRRS